jgi:hypothetical protein
MAHHDNAVTKNRSSGFGRRFHFVVAGLDPATHRLRKNHFAKRMDARVKPAHDR